MRVYLQCGIILGLTVLSAAGCKSGGGGLWGRSKAPPYSVASSAPGAGYHPDLPSAKATPNAVGGGFAANGNPSGASRNSPPAWNPNSAGGNSSGVTPASALGGVDDLSEVNAGTAGGFAAGNATNGGAGQGMGASNNGARGNVQNPYARSNSGQGATSGPGSYAQQDRYDANPREEYSAPPKTTYNQYINEADGSTAGNAGRNGGDAPPSARSDRGVERTADARNDRSSAGNGSRYDVHSRYDQPERYRSDPGYEGSGSGTNGADPFKDRSSSSNRSKDTSSLVDLGNDETNPNGLSRDATQNPPGDSQYRPGNTGTGYSPPNVKPYKPPRGNTSNGGPSSDSDAAYRPGGTGDYKPTGRPRLAQRPGGDRYARASADTSGNVQPASHNESRERYSAGNSAALAENDESIPTSNDRYGRGSAREETRATYRDAVPLDASMDSDRVRR